MLLIVGPLNLRRGLRARRRLKLFAGGVVPIRELKRGDVMVSGIAVTDEPLVSPITGTECIYYEHSIEEHWEKYTIETSKKMVRTDGDPEYQSVTNVREVRSNGFKVLGKGQDVMPFWIRDATGDVLVHPARAKIEPLVTFDGAVDQSSPYYDVPNVKGFGKFFRPGHPTGIRRLHEAAVPYGEWDGQVTVIGPVEIVDGVPRVKWDSPWWRPGRAANRFLITHEEPGGAERKTRRQMIKGLVLGGASLVGILGLYMTDPAGFGS